MAINKRYRKEAESAYVERQRKAVPFTVERIGGADQLADWKMDQIRKEDAWQAGKEARYQCAKERAISVLTGEEELSPSLAKEAYNEKVYLQTLEMISKAESLNRYGRLPYPEALAALKPTVFQRFKSGVVKACKSLWQNAFENS